MVRKNHQKAQFPHKLWRYGELIPLCTFDVFIFVFAGVKSGVLGFVYGNCL